MRAFIVLIALVVAVAARGGHHDHSQHIGRDAGEWNIEVHDPKHKSVAHGRHGMRVIINQAELPPGKEYMVGNPYPGAESMPIEYVYGVCHMKAVSSKPMGSDVSGSVYMRQPWMGCADVDVFYDITGLPHMEHDEGVVGEHSFKIHKYGDLSNDCANVGPRFAVENREHAGHADHENPCDPDDQCCNYKHNTKDVRGGDLGDFPCADGALHMAHRHNQFTVMGFHTVVGRSIVVSHEGYDLGCCTIGTTNGTSIPSHISFPDEPDAHHHH